MQKFKKILNWSRQVRSRMGYLGRSLTLLGTLKNANGQADTEVFCEIRRKVMERMSQSRSAYEGNACVRLTRQPVRAFQNAFFSAAVVIAFVGCHLLGGGHTAHAASPEEAARFFSGCPLNPGSPLAVLQQNPSYQEEVQPYIAQWQLFDERYFTKMRRFSQQDLIPRLGSAPQVILYPFGGPDILNAYALFPDASFYVLVGLEPVGQLPALEQMSPMEIHQGFVALRNATLSLFQYSFFITKEMQLFLNHAAFRGVLPLLLSFLSLTGSEITDVCFFHLTPTGLQITSSFSSSPLSSGATRSFGVSGFSKSVGGSGPAGVQIIFHHPAKLGSQSVYYLQANVANSELSSSLLNWLHRLPEPTVTYLKSASYLLHEEEFSNFRAFLLSKSQGIVQDDSGIPLRYFSPGGWHLSFFGKYNGPIALFHTRYQADLQQRFDQGSYPLPFGTGYHWQPGSSNLMVAKKQYLP